MEVVECAYERGGVSRKEGRDGGEEEDGRGKEEWDGAHLASRG